MENKTNENKGIVIQTIIAFSLCAILLFLLVFQFSKVWALKQEQQELDNKIQAIQTQNAKYSDELEYYLSDDYLEDVAHKHNKYDPNKEYVV